MHVGIAAHIAVFGDERVVIDEHARRIGPAIFDRAAHRHVVDDVSIEVGRPAEDRLRAQPVLRRVEAAVAHDADVMYAAVGFNKIVNHYEDVIVVDVYRHSLLILRFGRRAIRADINAVVEVSDVVVTDDVPLPVYFDPIIRLKRRGLIFAEIRPADQPVPIITTEQNIVRDVEILRAGILGRDADVDVLHPAVPHYEPATPKHVFQAGVKSDRRVANGDALEVVVIRRHHVEEPEVPGAIEDHFAIASGFDDDGFLRRPVARQHIRAIERYAVRRHVIRPVGLVESRVNEDHIARLDGAFVDHLPIACAWPVVSLFKTFERGLLFRSVVIWRINVKCATALIDFRRAARFYRYLLNRLPDNAVRIRHREAAFITGLFFQIDNAAREHARRPVFQELPRPYDLLVADPQQWQRFAPRRLSDLSVLDGHRRVAVVVAFDLPLESEVDQGRRLYDEITRCDRVIVLLGIWNVGGKHPYGCQEDCFSCHGQIS